MTDLLYTFKVYLRDYFDTEMEVADLTSSISRGPTYFHFEIKVADLTSNVSRRPISFDAEMEVADLTYLTWSQSTDTGPTSASTDSKTPGAQQGSPTRQTT